MAFKDSVIQFNKLFSKETSSVPFKSVWNLIETTDWNWRRHRVADDADVDDDADDADDADDKKRRKCFAKFFVEISSDYVALNRDL